MAPQLLDLPARPLSLKGDVVSMPKALFWAVPIVLALGIFLLAWEGPDLWRDIRISFNPVEVEGDVRNGQCTTRRGVFTDCKAQVAYSFDGKAYQSDVRIMFLDIHMGDYEAGVVISRDNPELATLTLGLDKLWNRILTLGGFCLLLFGICLYNIFQYIRALGVQKRLRNPAVLKEIPVEVTGFETRKDSLFITYTDNLAEDKTGRVTHTRLENGQLPMIVGQQNGHAMALAVRHGNSALPVLLDDQLARIEMTEEERQTALRPLEGLDVPSDEGAATQAMAGPPAPSAGQVVMRGVKAFVGIILLMIVGAVGFWVWYVTNSPTAFQQPGMEINNMMPEPLNRWGCDQLKARFGHDRAPYGCTAADHQSWK